MSRSILLPSAAVLAHSLLFAAGCASRPMNGSDGEVPAPAGVRAASPEPAYAVRKKLRVLTTNDFHGHLRPTTPGWAGGREVGGAAALAAYVALAREGTDAPVILLDAGDIMQGTPLSNLSHGRWTVEFYNHIGYAAAAFGNHELDWGVDTLAARVRQAEFAWLGANIRVAGTDTLPSWSRATHSTTLPGCEAGAPACDSVRVGIIGITTTATPESVLPSNAAGLEFEDEAAAIDRWVPRLRAEGVDFVIVTAHEGARCTAGPDPHCAGAMIEIASRLTHPPDLIVSGHTHAVVATRASGSPVVSSGEYGTRLSIVDLERFAGDSVAVTFVDQPVTWVDEVEPDAETVALIEGFEAEVGQLLDRVVTTLAAPLERRPGEYPLGNLIADAQRQALDAEIAIMNTGGIRTSLPAGEIRYEDLFRLQPFGNTLVLVELSGATIREAVEHALTGGRAAAHFSGLRATYDPAAPPGTRLLGLELESGEPIEAAGVYRVAINNFLAEGGDGFDMLLDGEVVRRTDIVDLDALIRHLESLPAPVRAPEERRLVPVSTPAPAGAR